MNKLELKSREHSKSLLFFVHISATFEAKIQKYQIKSMEELHLTLQKE